MSQLAQDAHQATPHCHGDAHCKGDDVCATGQLQAMLESIRPMLWEGSRWRLMSQAQGICRARVWCSLYLSRDDSSSEGDQVDERGAWGEVLPQKFNTGAHGHVHSQPCSHHQRNAPARHAESTHVKRACCCKLLAGAMHLGCKDQLWPSGACVNLCMCCVFRQAAMQIYSSHEVVKL